MDNACIVYTSRTYIEVKHAEKSGASCVNLPGGRCRQICQTLLHTGLNLCREGQEWLGILSDQMGAGFKKQSHADL